jgi:N-acetylmuramoyl-L-alanine amidase
MIKSMKNTLRTLSLVAIMSIGTTTAQAASSNCTSNDCKHIAEAVYHEARGEGKQGMIAVANVIMNRTRSRNKTAAQIVQAKGQFSYRTKRYLGFSDKKSYNEACSIANGVLNKTIKDNTGGATYFRSGGGTWGRNFKQTTRIGNHAFFINTK